MSDSRLYATEQELKAKPARRSKRLWIAIGVVVIVLVVIASVAYLANRPARAPAAPLGPNVTVWDTGFCSNTGNCGYTPASKNTTVGGPITWTNTGGQAHTVTECIGSDSSTACPNGSGANTSTSRAFDSNTQYSSGFKSQQYTFAFNLSPGIYYYYCTLHPWMHGTVMVGA